MAVAGEAHKYSSPTAVGRLNTESADTAAEWPHTLSLESELVLDV